MKQTKYLFVKIYQVTGFVVFYLFEMIKANILIAGDILSPKAIMEPGIVKIELDVTSDHEILSFFNLISMTPGTLSVDLSEDKKFIYVHAWNIDDVEEFKKSIKNKLEKRVMEVFR
jgi:multicomponent Na+:H+ antiporter subunit E